MTSLSRVCYLVFAQFLTKEHIKKQDFLIISSIFLNYNIISKYTWTCIFIKKKKKDNKFCIVRNAKCYGTQ
jgi:hypothetical protein